MGIPLHTLWISAGYGPWVWTVLQAIDGYFRCDESVIARSSSRFATQDSVQRSQANPRRRLG
jgi:hypothetical protein